MLFVDGAAGTAVVLLEVTFKAKPEQVLMEPEQG